MFSYIFIYIYPKYSILPKTTGFINYIKIIMSLLFLCQNFNHGMRSSICKTGQCEVDRVPNPFHPQIYFQTSPFLPHTVSGKHMRREA